MCWRQCMKSIEEPMHQIALTSQTISITRLMASFTAICTTMSRSQKALIALHVVNHKTLLKAPEESQDKTMHRKETNQEQPPITLLRWKTNLRCRPSTWRIRTCFIKLKECLLSLRSKTQQSRKRLSCFVIASSQMDHVQSKLPASRIQLWFS